MKGGLKNKGKAGGAGEQFAIQRQLLKGTSEVDDLGGASPKKLQKKKTSNNMKQNVHLVNNFEEIGWFDPYEARKPNKKCGETMPQHSIIGACFDELTYDKCKFHESYPPLIIYLPTEAIMRKMMKACAPPKDYEGPWTIDDVLSKF